MQQIKEANNAEKKPMHEKQQDEEESWQKNTDDKNDRHTDIVTIKSYRVKSVRSVIIAKLETRSGKVTKNCYTE